MAVRLCDAKAFCNFGNMKPFRRLFGNDAVLIAQRFDLLFARHARGVKGSRALFNRPDGAPFGFGDVEHFANHRYRGAGNAQLQVAFITQRSADGECLPVFMELARAIFVWVTVGEGFDVPPQCFNIGLIHVGLLHPAEHYLHELLFVTPTRPMRFRRTEHFAQARQAMHRDGRH